MSSSLALDHLASGKVRELYDAGDGRLLLVASDRISAFDVILPTPPFHLDDMAPIPLNQTGNSIL